MRRLLPTPDVQFVPLEEAEEAELRRVVVDLLRTLAREELQGAAIDEAGLAARAATGHAEPTRSHGKEIVND